MPTTDARGDDAVVAPSQRRAARPPLAAALARAPRGRRARRAPAGGGPHRRGRRPRRDDAGARRGRCAGPVGGAQPHAPAAPRRRAQVGLAGAAVRQLQRSSGSAPTGTSARRRARALKRWQRAHGMKADGVAGPATLGPSASRRRGPPRRAGRARRRAASRRSSASPQCESGGDPTAVSADGRYRGKYQFSARPGRRSAARAIPAEASEAEQDRLAATLSPPGHRALADLRPSLERRERRPRAGRVATALGDLGRLGRQRSAARAGPLAAESSWQARAAPGRSPPAGRSSTRRSRAPAPAHAHRMPLGRRRASAAPAPARRAHDGVGGHVGGDDAARPDDGVVADGHAAQEARAVADPHVVADAHVALVDPLLADRALDLDDAVVEVDEHHAVGDDALAADRDVLERRDRALLAEHALGADHDLALVGADLRAVADPATSGPRRTRGAPARSRTSRPGRRSTRPSVCSRPRQRSLSHSQRSASRA